MEDLAKIGSTSTLATAASERSLQAFTASNIENLRDQIGIIAALFNPANYLEGDGKVPNKSGLKKLSDGFVYLGLAIHTFHDASLRNAAGSNNDIGAGNLRVSERSSVTVREVLGKGPALCARALDILANQPELRHRVDDLIKSIAQGQRAFTNWEIIQTRVELPPGVAYAWDRTQERAFREVMAEIGDVKGAIAMIRETKKVLQVMLGPEKQGGLWSETVRLADRLKKLCFEGGRKDEHSWAAQAPKGNPQKGSGFSLQKAGEEPKNGRPDTPA